MSPVGNLASDGKLSSVRLWATASDGTPNESAQRSDRKNGVRLIGTPFIPRVIDRCFEGPRTYWKPSARRVFPVLAREESTLTDYTGQER